MMRFWSNTIRKRTTTEHFVQDYAFSIDINHYYINFPNILFVFQKKRLHFFIFQNPYTNFAKECRKATKKTL